MTGTLWGIGVGPGDPDLLTVKAVKVLAGVAALAYPLNADGGSQARTIAAPHLPAGLPETGLPFSFTPDADSAPAYRAAAARLTEALADGDVAVLCEGDPLLYGTFGNLLPYLDATVPVRVVPGIAAATAAAATVARPLASGDGALAVLPATLGGAALAARLAHGDAAVILKPGRHTPAARRALAHAGRLADALAVARATRAGEWWAPLTDLPEDATLPYFSLILVPEAAP